MCRDRRNLSRRGSVLILMAFLTVALIAAVALAVDLGYASVARSEMQNAADAACLDGAAVLLDRDELKGSPNQTAEIAAARQNASAFARANALAFSGLSDSPTTATTSQGQAVAVNSNYVVDNSLDADPGYLANPGDVNSTLQYNSGAPPTPFSPPVLMYVPPFAGTGTEAVSQLVGKVPLPGALPDVVNAATALLAPPAVITSYNSYNSVKFRVRRGEESANDPLDLFFAKALPGNSGQMDLEATATATWEDNIKGFRIRTNSGGAIVGPNVSRLLPFAMDVNTFAAMAAGLSTIDLYVYDPNGGPVTKPVYPGTPPDYRNRVSMSNSTVAWLTETPPTDAADLLKWDKLNPFSLYRRLRQAAEENVPAHPLTGFLPPWSSNFWPFDPDTYSGLFPGDGIKEALLIPITLQRRRFNVVSVPFIGRIPLVGSLKKVADVHVGNFGCLYLGNGAATSLTGYLEGLNADLGEFERQVIYGPNQSDFAELGGRLQLGSNGSVTIKGTTLVPTALKSLLKSIRGQPRVIALYEPQTVDLLPSNLTGDSLVEANYKIVGFAGVTVLDVFDIPNPDAIAYDNGLGFVYRTLLRALEAIDPVTFGALGAAEDNYLSQANSIKVFIQPEFVIDATAIGGGAALSIPAGRKTSAFVYRPLVITR